MDLLDWPYRLKSARRKRRLVKKDRDKQLIKLHKLQDSLLQYRRNLPMIILEHPYQRGWKRLFVLRADVQLSPKASFYETLLAKINTVRYHHDKTFKKGKRRKRRYHYEEKEQKLQTIDEYYWLRNKHELTDAEKSCFYRRERWSAYYKRITVDYVFAEPWRFVLVVRPHIIYQVKMVDEVLEQQLGTIDNYIDYNHLWPRINRLTRGRSDHHWDGIDKPKYINKFKNLPAYAYKEANLE